MDAAAAADRSLTGIGLYTAAEAGRLLRIAPGKLSRWLRGHTTHGVRYEPLWTPEVDLGDDTTILSFRDLLEARVAALFIDLGLTPQKVRAAIRLARAEVGERPLSTTWLRTDGQRVFLRTLEEGEEGEPKLLDLFRRQFAFNAVVDPSLKDVDFKGVAPRRWWPRGRRIGVVIDPDVAFGQPIERETSIPAEVLANAANAEGSAERAARAWQVPVRAVQRANRFQRELDQQRAA